jgi:hypothetical protein
VTLKFGFLALAVFAAVVLGLAPPALAETEVPGDAGFVILGSKTGNGAGIVRVRTNENDPFDGIYEHANPASFPYPGSAVGDGVRVAVGDFNGDGNQELVTAAGKGVPVKIWAINPDGTIGDLIDSKTVFERRRRRARHSRRLWNADCQDLARHGRRPEGFRQPGRNVPRVRVGLPRRRTRRDGKHERRGR